jgi:hypothetical protein
LGIVADSFLIIIPAEAGIQLGFGSRSSFPRASSGNPVPLLWFLILSDRIPSFFRSHPCERVTFLCLHKEK